jgi:hypothetical protein
MHSMYLDSMTKLSYDVNSILADIYLTKLQNLINRPVMNCSMSIFPYFYFSNNILFDFPSSGLIFLPKLS